MGNKNEMTEKACLLELEQKVRFVMQYEMDEDFVKQIRITLKCAIDQLDKIRERKARLKESRDANKYAKEMGLQS